jgi:hypothetical protein
MPKKQKKKKKARRICRTFAHLRETAVALIRALMVDGHNPEKTENKIRTLYEVAYIYKRRCKLEYT